jgi:phenylpropionate dioxygenase-like ring-hydroxylating dioxygenase large terminal subunit
MNSKVNPPRPVGPHYLTDEEIRAVRNPQGVPSMLPPRCYYDNDIYRFEVEKIFRRNWLAVGRWDQVEKPGDYFTAELLGEPLIIVRDQDSVLRALTNTCQHRWAAVASGAGHTELFTCPYHRWTYNLDGSLRGISLQNIEGLDRKKCSLPSHRVEIWQGWVFVNFDPDAEPLAPQLKELSHLLDRYRLSEYRMVYSYHYEAPWNWKFSFENGAEAYHHVGIHHDRVQHLLPAELSYTSHTGKNYLLYRTPPAPGMGGYLQEFGLPDGAVDDGQGMAFFGVFPNLMCGVDWGQLLWIHFWHDSPDRNRSTTALAMPPHVLRHPRAEEFKKLATRELIAVQEEDTQVLLALQKGVVSRYARPANLHPLETGQLQHFHQWLVDQYLAP